METKTKSLTDKGSELPDCSAATAYIPGLWSEQHILEALWTTQRITINWEGKNLSCPQSKYDLRVENVIRYHYVVFLLNRTTLGGPTSSPPKKHNKFPNFNLNKFQVSWYDILFFRVDAMHCA